MQARRDGVKGTRERKEGWKRDRTRIEMKRGAEIGPSTSMLISLPALPAMLLVLPMLVGLSLRALAPAPTRGRSTVLVPDKDGAGASAGAVSATSMLDTACCAC